VKWARRRYGSTAAPWLPTDIAGASAWYRGDKILGLSNNDPVGTWPEPINSLDVTQATEANKPLWIEIGLNGHPVVRGDGADDTLYRTSVPSTTIFPNAGELSFYLILKQVGSKADNYTIGWGETYVSQTDILATSNNVIYFDAPYGAAGEGRSSVAQPAGWDDTWHILICYRLTDGTQVIRVDRTDISSVSKSGNVPAVSGTLALFNSWSLDVPFQGDIADVLISSRGFTGGDITNLEDYSLTRYGL